MTPGAIMFLLDVVWVLLVWPVVLAGLLPALAVLVVAVLRVPRRSVK